MKPNPYTLAIIMINYRTPKLAIASLESILADIQELNILVTVVDNCSEDDSVDAIEQWISDKSMQDYIKLYRSTLNSGFASGNNMGLTAIQADYYLLLNSDTLVRKGALKILLDTIQQHEHVGLVSPRLEWLDGVPQESGFNYPTPVSELINSAKTGLLTQLLNRFNVAQAVVEVPCNYPWVSFACVLIRAKVFEDVGLMDEGYFMYFEDVEFCHRAKKMGWEIMYQPAAHVVHLRGGSSPLKALAKLRKRLPRYFYESRTRYFYQMYGRSGLLAANLLWSLGWLISWLRRLLSDSYLPDIAENQWCDIWLNFVHPLQPYLHPDSYDKT
jgi:GT2 family glycosyltransferase